MKKLDSELHIPKYILLKEEIKKLISEKQLKAHEKLLSRSELIRDFDVSEITVRKAIDELTNEGYVYRIHGKGTYVAETKEVHRTIALMAMHLYAMNDANSMYDIGFTAPIIHAIENEARSYDASVSLYLSHSNLQVERRNLLNLLERQVDGVVMMPISEWHNAEYVAQLKSAGLPIVLFDRNVNGVELDFVTTDNEAGAYEATLNLIEAGFERVHYFTTNEDVSTLRHRKAGYIRAMSERGLSHNGMVHVLATTLSLSVEERSACSLAMSALENESPGFAVVGAKAPIFVGLMNAIRELGLGGDDVAVACCDEPPVYVPDDILYVRVLQPLEEIGATSIRLVMDKIRGNKAFETVLLAPKVHTRKRGAQTESMPAGTRESALDRLG
ncbi:MAG: GntR family transcriptional regulator [Armatimonadota bacterium]